MTLPLVTIIIPVFNKWELTYNCLNSLKEHTPQELFHIIVVDNGSTDETATALPEIGNRLFGDNFSLIRFATNKNFSPACNAGAKAATTPFLFLLNNDTILHPNWLPPLLAAFDSRPNAGAVGPLLLFEDETVQHLGVTFSCYSVTHMYQFFPRSHPLVQKPRTLQVLTGAALLLPREVYYQCGGLYEGYINGCEDIELSLRIGELGKKLYSVPESVITHLESQTPGRIAHDKENFQILYSRCQHLVRVDLHHHALRDGLHVGINEVGELYVANTAQQSEDFFAQTKTLSNVEFARFIQNAPLWVEGREYLATVLDQNGCYQEAVSVWSELVRLRGNKKYHTNLMQSASKAQRPDLEEIAQELYTRYIARSNPIRQRQKIDQQIQRARYHNDTYLVNLLNAHLANLRKQ